MGIFCVRQFLYAAGGYRWLERSPYFHGDSKVPTTGTIVLTLSFSGVGSCSLLPGGMVGHILQREVLSHLSQWNPLKETIRTKQEDILKATVPFLLEG